MDYSAPLTSIRTAPLGYSARGLAGARFQSGWDWNGSLPGPRISVNSQLARDRQGENAEAKRARPLAAHSRDQDPSTVKASDHWVFRRLDHLQREVS